MFTQRVLVVIKKIIPGPIFKFFQPYYHYTMSYVAAFWYRFPSEKLIVIGVTGTTGKTTSVYLMAEMFRECGLKVGYTSTAMFSNGDRDWLNDKKMTMLGRFFTQKMLSQMVKNGCRYVIIETTSEGIVQFRHRFIDYDVLVFTGLYSEHLESHGGFENYKQAKGLLFAHLEKCKVKHIDDQKNVLTGLSKNEKSEAKRVEKIIIANGDDDYCDYFLRFWAEKKYKIKSKKFEVKSGEDKLLENKIEEISINKLKVNKLGMQFELYPIYDFELYMLGEFNVMNVSFGIVAAYTQNLKMVKIKNYLKKIRGVPGRLEQLDFGQNFKIIVDYAFEPVALHKLFDIVNAKLRGGRVIHVLGSAGGGRDVARRPELGKISAQNADIVIVTNEDPYDEDPLKIMIDVAVGAKKGGKKEDKDLYIIEDRRKAIFKALSLAKKNDVVLVTGKGSEQAICVKNGETIPWDDRKVVKVEYEKL
ncbi:UDP-N-acetylmuramyl-tripeptide synthetase [Patescibacteria group bacterium]|nr:UDP-N-acetylmuramyl-tripeptide synthetase [Patescibacteria group bacterium]